MYQAGLQVTFINRLKRKRRMRMEANAMSMSMSMPSPLIGQVDIPLNSGRGGKWGRRRPGSTRYSFMSNASQDSEGSKPAFVDIEEEFLHAAEFGDIPNVKRILANYADLNIDCIDALGRTALRLAVKNEHLEVVEVLLEKSNQHHIYEAVLQAISAGHTQIAETILKHRRYLEMWKERRKLGDTDGFYKTAFPDSQFSPDITPLILASQKNQYEIVQLLLLRGETIMKPHKFSCGCQECRNRMKFDQLRLAKYRLNAYRGLASEAYISLSSKDPILTAFELAAELRRLSRVEKHFKREYRDLADQLSDYVVKLLDRIRTQKELELVLNKTGKPHQEKFESLARFKLALNYKEKKFVAHSSCQQRVVRIWYNGMGKLERANWPNRLLMISMFTIAYPFLVLLHIFLPNCKGAKVLQFPVVKFLCNAMSFLGFLLLIVVSTIESSQSVSKYRTLGTEYPRHHEVYGNFCEIFNNSVYGPDFPLRASFPSVTEILMSLWIVGMVCQECNQLFHNGLIEHMLDLYNLLDVVLITVYLATFSLRYWTMYKFHMALYFMENPNNLLDERGMLESVYWLNTDRIFWTPTDPINLLEGSFAVANILSVSRISYLLPANEILGPLQISLGRMLKDIAKFGVLFVLVIFAFMVGLHNLYWYYSEREDIELQFPDRPEPQDVKAAENFGGVFATFRTVFWAMFGRGEPDAVQLGGYNNTFTSDIGYVIYGAYNVAMVTVLLNMLIAMMTRSFTLIAEDSDREWKYSRSLLYMDYIRAGGTLPAPLNIIGAPKALFRLIFCNCCCCGEKHSDSDGQDDDYDDDAGLYPPRKGPLQNGRDVPRTHPGKLASIEGPPGGAHPGDDIVAHREINGRVNEAFDGTPTKTAPRPPSTMVALESAEEKLTYQQTMQRIVQRYIFDIQREAEVTEDDFEEIKQDISSFRYDMINHMTNKTVVEDELKAHMATIMQQLQTLKEELTPEKRPGKIFEKKIDISKQRITEASSGYATGHENPSIIAEDPETPEDISGDVQAD
ncbi:unnamed protein product [Lymnaea stagnalis]|uniref:Transient receptor ion channel domain-containing protein n=1 Tax=Lymnaea stagnalis TaxID=6523 RepID=A0AAV2HG16_LYMST